MYQQHFLSHWIAYHTYKLDLILLLLWVPFPSPSFTHLNFSVLWPCYQWVVFWVLFPHSCLACAEFRTRLKPNLFTPVTGQSTTQKNSINRRPPDKLRYSPMYFNWNAYVTDHKQQTTRLSTTRAKPLLKLKTLSWVHHSRNNRGHVL
jgi:hypothetical protein